MMNGLTALSSASTSPSASQLESTLASSPDASTNNSYAFLIHSQDTLPRNLPPEVDNKPLARQKRRRTSPEDQAILEAEYQRNPKPDKAARLDIVQRVALGEKEVQIWFQNRRQNFRRKAKPLLPHELPQPRPSPQQPTSVMDIAAITTNTDQGGSSFLDESRRARERAGAVSHLNHVRPSTSSAITRSLIASARNAISFGASQGSQTSVSISPFEVDTSFDTAPTDPNSSQHTLTWDDSRSESLRYQAGKASPRDPSLLSYGSSASRDTALTSSQSGVTPLLGPRRSSSSLRLCLSLDGKAQVVEMDEDPFVWSQPAPREPPSQRIRALQRSHSAILSSEEFRPPSMGLPLPRKRDAGVGHLLGPRDWEIFCDGPTVGAQMLPGGARRAESNKNLGTSIPDSHSGLRRSPLPFTKPIVPSRWGSSSKRAAPGSKVPKLARATSSLARLQTYSGAAAEAPIKLKAERKPSSTHLQSPTGDSDKENCAPDDEEQPQESLHNNLSSHRGARAVLGESEATRSGATTSNPMKRAGKALTGHRRPRTNRARKGHVDATAGKADEEPSIVEEEEDLNCVHTLLSLSQGSWC